MSKSFKVRANLTNLDSIWFVCKTKNAGSPDQLVKNLLHITSKLSLSVIQDQKHDLKALTKLVNAQSRKSKQDKTSTQLDSIEIFKFKKIDKGEQVYVGFGCQGISSSNIGVYVNGVTTWKNNSESTVADFDQVERTLRSSYYNISWKFPLTTYFKDLNGQIQSVFVKQVKNNVPDTKDTPAKKRTVTFQSKNLRYLHTPYALPKQEPRPLQKTKKITKKVGKK